MGRANGSLPGLGGSAVEEDAPKVHGKTNLTDTLKLNIELFALLIHVHVSY